jgi:starch synthase
MKIAFVSSEVFPYAKTGGLADVAGSLPIELAKLGHEVKVFMPNYNSIDHNKYFINRREDIAEFPVRVGGWDRSVKLYNSFLPNSNVEIIFIDHPYYFHRNKIYTNNWDEDERFIFFQKGMIESLQRLQWKPDIIHCNDWQTGLIPLLVKDNYKWDKFFDNIAFVYTIHNIAYQGRFGKDTLLRAEIDEKFFNPPGIIEHDGDVNFMKAAIMMSEVVNTVSNTYAKELLTSEYGAGMENYLKYREQDFYGIINGIDYDIWNPEKDKLIPHHYSIDNFEGKKKNKQHLVEKFGLSYHENIPLIGIISRMVSQKGFDIIAPIMNDLMKMNIQLVVLGSGESHYQSLFNQYAYYYPDKVGAYIGFNNELSHLIEAGSDIFLMPSHYEPCGLNQIYSLKYGTVPVVRKTGGLADTVQDWNEYNSYGMDIGNGYSFYDYSSSALLQSIKRAVNDFHNKPVWEKIIRNGMVKDYSWKHSAEEYVELYKKAVQKI